MTNSLALGKVVGANLRRIRSEKGMTLEDLSRSAQKLGCEWSISRVTAIQRGTREPKLGTLILLATALNCHLEDLMQTDAEWIDLGNVTVSTKDLKQTVAGGLPPEILNSLGGSRMKISLVDERTARMIGISGDELARVTEKLWGKSVEDERLRRSIEENRVPSDVTIELRNEIRAYLEEIQ